MYEPLIVGSTVITNEGKIFGQLWDSVVASDDLSLDTTISFDSRTFFTVGASSGNYANTLANGKIGLSPRFSLCVVVP
jgi:hypothetical protein